MRLYGLWLVMSDHADTIRRGIWVLDNDDVCAEADIALDALLAERQQAIDALREIARRKYRQTGMEDAGTARAALEKLGEKP